MDRHVIALDVITATADHGRADWLGYWDEFVQKARFKKLVCLCHIKQNNLAYLGRVCTPCLSMSTGIYAATHILCLVLYLLNVRDIAKQMGQRQT